LRNSTHWLNSWKGSDPLIKISLEVGSTDDSRTKLPFAMGISFAGATAQLG
jgi:hypothetical protein